MSSAEHFSGFEHPGASFEGSPNVFKRLEEKRRLLEAGLPHNHIRPILIILGGGLRGAFSAGAVCALKDAGYIHPTNPALDTFDAVIGSSTGAPVAACFLGGNLPVGATVYHEECVDRPFFSLSRYATGKGPAADVQYLCRVFRGEEGRKPLNQSRIYASRSKFFTAATRVESGKIELLDAKKTHPDVVEAVHISIAIPGLYKPHVEHKGVRYTDGGFGHPYPIDTILKKFPRATDVVVVSNTAEKVAVSAPSVAEKIVVSRLVSEPVRSLFLSKHTLFNEALSKVRRDRARNYLTLWPANGLNALRESRGRLEKASRDAERAVSSAIEKARNSV